MTRNARTSSVNMIAEKETDAMNEPNEIPWSC